MNIKSPSAKRPFKIPFNISLQYAISFNPWVSFCIFSLSIVFISLLSIFVIYKSIEYYQYLFSISPLLRDAGFAGLFGALIGALLAAVIGGGISYILQTHEIKAASLSKKKNELYIPLYNNLLELQNSLRDRPHPTSFTTQPNALVPMSGVSLAVWGEIEQDSRRIHVPPWIRIAVITFEKNFQIYNNFKKEFHEETIKHIELTLLLVNKSPQYNLKRVYSEGHYFAEEILTGSPLRMASTLQQISGVPYSKPEDITSEFEDLGEMVYQVCRSLPQYEKTSRYYQIYIINYLDWLIYEVGQLIKLISIRYENMRDEF